MPYEYLLVRDATRGWLSPPALRLTSTSILIARVTEIGDQRFSDADARRRSGTHAAVATLFSVTHNHHTIRAVLATGGAVLANGQLTLHE